MLLSFAQYCKSRDAYVYESIHMAHKVLLPCEGTLAPLIDVEEQNKFTCTHSVFFAVLHLSWQHALIERIFLNH